MKIVVTGGSGFIGSHIVEYWSNNNAEVHVLDNLRSGFEHNITPFKNVIFQKGSITDKPFVNQVLKDATYVFHLAALISVPESLEKPDECLDINVKGLLNVLEACKRK